jgi:Mn-dependent DtxR family transcriptional regulator
MKPPKNQSSKKGAKADTPRVERPEHRWTFLSNHAHVLICLARDPEIRLRDVADLIGITERAVLNVIADLEEEGLVQRYREGRRNSYELSLDRPLRHPIERHRNVGELVRLIIG